MVQLDIDVPVDTHIIDLKPNVDDEKLGRYGVMMEASTFLGILIPNMEVVQQVRGYEFENLILLATHEGLCTM